MSRARQFLAAYRDHGASQMVLLEEFASNCDIALDFSVSSLDRVFAAAAGSSTVVEVTDDLSLRDWIRETESYRAGLFEFDERTREMVVRLSYYLAVSLIEAGNGALSWAIGEAGTAVQNQPVVRGFSAGVEMSPMLVAGTLLRRLHRSTDPQDAEDVRRAVEHWLSMIPKESSSNPPP